jgi:hypothetical protein
MLLTDAHIRNAKPTAKAFKLSDGGGMYLIVTPANARYWRMDLSVRRTLAMGVYPTVSLATARQAVTKPERCWLKILIPSPQRRLQNGQQSSRTKIHSS